LCRLSKSYRQHDAVLLERTVAQSKLATVKAERDKLRRDLEETKWSLALATEAQQNATEQLISERALRQAAEDRASAYHGELTESLKQSANYLSLSLNRKAMFGGVIVDEPIPDPKPSVRQPTKPMAREVARGVSDKTLQDMLAEIKAQERDAESQVQ
jgi:hypothetical protein